MNCVKINQTNYFFEFCQSPYSKYTPVLQFVSDNLGCLVKDLAPSTSFPRG